MALQYKLLPALQFKASTGKNHQYISQLINLEFDELGVNNQIWALADDDEIPVINARQHTLGFIYRKQGWQFDIEAYHKKLLGITSFTTSFISQANEDNYSEGTATIQGIDLLLKKKWNKYQTWLSYTLSKADYLFEEIQVETFPSFNDQRHVLSWVHLWKFPRFDISVGWNMASGLPYTDFEETKIDTDFPDDEDLIAVVSPIYDLFNTNTLANTHRLNASILYTFPDKSASKKWEAKAGLSFTNIYNKANIYTRRFDEQYFYEDDELEDEVIIVEKRLLQFFPNVHFRVAWK